MRKVFVDVTATFTKDGNVLPVNFIWEDGRQYTVDKVLDKRKAASFKVGGHGIRYTCRILGKQTYLFLEDGRWFVEAN